MSVALPAREDEIAAYMRSHVGVGYYAAKAVIESLKNSK